MPSRGKANQCYENNSRSQNVRTFCRSYLLKTNCARPLPNMAIFPVFQRNLGMITARMSSSSPVGRPVASQTPPVPENQVPLNAHRVSTFEKYLLVWTKKFKSLSDVPPYVSRDMIEKARNVSRIRTNLSIIGLTFIGCIVMIQSGKRAAERGESATKDNLEWHRKYNEENSTKPAN